MDEQTILESAKRIPRTKLSRECILVRFTTSRPGQTKTDRGASVRAAEAEGASSKDVKVVVETLKPLLAKITSILTSAYNFHRQETIEWPLEGVRLLHLKRMEQYEQGMKKFRDDLEAAVNSAVAMYPDFIEERKRELGSLFHAEHYPASGEDLRSSISMSVGFIPIPEAADAHFELPEEKVIELRQAILREVADGCDAATQEAYIRFIEPLAKLAAKLQEFDPSKGRAGGYFKDATIEAVKAAAELASEHGALLDQPKLVEAAEEMKTILNDPIQGDPETLRKNKVVRETVADKATVIAKKMSEFFGE